MSVISLDDIDEVSDIATRLEEGRSDVSVLHLRISGHRYDRALTIATRLEKLGSVEFLEPVAQDEEYLLEFLAVLRELATLNVPVSWNLASAPGESVLSAAVYHLPPPRESDVELANAWIAQYRYGDLYFRRGPGFVTITRNGPISAARFVLDDAASLDVFMGSMSPTDEKSLRGDPAKSSAIDELISDGLLLRRHQQIVALPYRMTRWPIPMLAI